MLKSETGSAKVAPAEVEWFKWLAAEEVIWTSSSSDCRITSLWLFVADETYWNSSKLVDRSAELLNQRCSITKPKKRLFKG